MRVSTFLLLAALACLAACGPPPGPVNSVVPRKMACCVRSFLRNTATAPKAGADSKYLGIEADFNMGRDGRREPDVEKRGRDGGGKEVNFFPFDIGSTYATAADGKPNLWGVDQNIITSGDVAPYDTMCVDGDMKAFRKYLDLYEKGVESAVDQLQEDQFDGIFPDNRREVGEEEGKYECRVGRELYIVENYYDCRVLQECNNVQQDTSQCADVCNFWCSGDLGYDGATPPWFSGSFEGLGCYDQCRLTCEYKCVGVCENDPECVFDCVEEEGFINPESFEGLPNRREADLMPIDGKPMKDLPDPFTSTFHFPNLLLDFLFGNEVSVFNEDRFETAGLFGTTDGGRPYTGFYPKRSARSVQSVARPGFSVRRNELELTMSLYPDSNCEDLRYVCNSGI
eukprot:TRINITY_DN406_c0_g1_i1.p1 TRINITY_DN406_c0_g1~~TRINITY_DN406_c0_g1_i1.p1  ORF type:complete len:406 (+),score=68.60 TRINITY_DN406_c0_g1_i1:27-1220(+)